MPWPEDAQVADGQQRQQAPDVEPQSVEGVVYVCKRDLPLPPCPVGSAAPARRLAQGRRFQTAPDRHRGAAVQVQKPTLERAPPVPSATGPRRLPPCVSVRPCSLHLSREMDSHHLHLGRQINQPALGANGAHIPQLKTELGVTPAVHVSPPAQRSHRWQRRDSLHAVEGKCRGCIGARRRPGAVATQPARRLLFEQKQAGEVEQRSALKPRRQAVQPVRRRAAASLSLCVGGVKKARRRKQPQPDRRRGARCQDEVPAALREATVRHRKPGGSSVVLRGVSDPPARALLIEPFRHGLVNAQGPPHVPSRRSDRGTSVRTESDVFVKTKLAWAPPAAASPGRSSSSLRRPPTGIGAALPGCTAAEGVGSDASRMRAPGTAAHRGAIPEPPRGCGDVPGEPGCDPPIPCRAAPCDTSPVARSRVGGEGRRAGASQAPA
eukprot:scaffold5866_cov93-Isochrysis_galbana.AAC.6